jgi:hypothetical protein
MLTPAEILNRLEVEREDFVFLMMGDMAEDVHAGRPHEPIPTFPQDPDNRLALAFSEALILCPDKGAVKSRMNSRRRGESFRAWFCVAGRSE